MSAASVSGGSSMKTLVVTLSINPRNTNAKPARAGIVHLRHIQDHRLALAELLADHPGLAEAGQFDGDGPDGARRLLAALFRTGLHGQRTMRHVLVVPARNRAR